MSVPISKLTTSSTSHDQARSATASDSINNIAGASLSEGCQFNNRNVCKVCNKLFSHKRNLKTHMQTHAGEKTHPCTECGKAFLRKYDLKRHMRVHTVEKPHSCTECDKAFARKDALINHMRTHREKEKKVFKCTVCNKCFPYMKKLTRHLEVSHQVAEVSKINPINSNNISASLNEGCQFNNRNVCKVCDKAFTRKYSLKIHMRNHTRSYSCTKCDKAFARKDVLINHMRTHREKKVFKCTVCNKCFPYMKKLTRHLEVSHQVAEVSKINPINSNNISASLNEGCQFNNRNVCKVCDKAFTSKYSLKIHMRTHTRSYSCTKCDKAFTKKCHLTIHIRTHAHDQARSATASDSINNDVTGTSLNESCQFNNRNVCKVCDKAFTRNYSLKIHMLTHTGEKLHPCTECDKAFARKDVLINHMRTHRGKKVFKCTVCNKCFPYMKKLTRHLEVSHQVAEVSKINPINSNNTRDKMIADYHQEIQDICKNRKIKICTTAIKNMIFTLRGRPEQLLTDEILNSFFYKTLLFLKHMTIPNSTATLTNMLLNRELNFSNNSNVILNITDEQLKKIASYKYIQDISIIYQQYGMPTYKEFTLYNNFLYQSNETESNIEIKSHATAMILKFRGLLSENLNKLSTFFAFPIFKDDKSNYKDKLLVNICKMLTIKTMPSEDELTTFLNNSHIKNNNSLLSKICLMCYKKGIPDENQLNAFLDNPKFKNEDGTSNYSLFAQICNMYDRKGIPDENQLNAFLDNPKFKNEDGTFNYSLIASICRMYCQKGTPDEDQLSIFLNNPKFKNKDGTINYSLIALICRMYCQKGTPDEDQLSIFLNNPKFKNKDGTINYSLIEPICRACFQKGIPDKKQLNIFLNHLKFKNNDGTINYSLIVQICNMCARNGIPDERELNVFLENSNFKNKDGTINYSLIMKICKMCFRKGIPDAIKLNIFLDNPIFKNKDGTINYSLIEPICIMCYQQGIPDGIKLNAFLENSNFKINSTINCDLIAYVCSICSRQGIPPIKKLNDFLTTIFACSSRTVKDNFLLIELLVTLTYRKGIPKKTIIANFISWLTEKKQINSEDCKAMRHLLFNKIDANRVIPTKEVLEKTEKKISDLLKAENIELDTEFGLNDFNIKILSLYQILKSDIGNTLTEFIKFYPKKSDLCLDDFIKILYINNLDNLSKILDLIKTSEFADKFNNLAYKKTIIQLLQIKNIKYDLIKETITNVLNLPLEDMVEYALITMTSAKKINREEFLFLSKCKKNLLKQKFAPCIVDKYLNILTEFNQDDIKKYSKLENFKIITKNMSLKSLNSLIQNVSISEINQIFNESINYSNGDITEQTSTTMFNTALMLNECMEATAEYNHEEFEFLSAAKNNTLVQLKNNNGEISNNIVLHDFLACIANNLNTEVDYTYDNKNKTLVVDSFFKEKSFVAPQLKIDKTGVIITNWSLAQTNDFFNFVYAKDEEEDDATNDVLSQKETALGKRKRSSTSTIESSPKQQKTDNSAKIPLNVIINIIQKGMFIKDSLWKTIYDYKDKLNNNCIQQLANKYKNHIPMDFNGYFYATMDFIQEKIDDNKLNMELEAIKSGIVDKWLLDQELGNSIKKLNHKEKSKDRTFFQQISAESLELKQTTAEATKRKLFADKIINYLKAQNSIIFNSTEMQILDILKEYKEFVSAEIITNHIIERILICNTDSTNEWEQIIQENSVIKDPFDTFENPFVDEEDEETVDELLDQMAFI